MNVKERIAKLIDVKSIVTLTLMVVFSYLAVIGTITAEQFMTVFVMIMTYFFSRRQVEPTVPTEE